MVNYSELDDTAQDLLREIGNIGTGNAVTALSSMVGHSFNVELPQVRIINYREAPELLGGAETFQTGILLEIGGELSGMFMFLLNEEFSKVMLDALLGPGDWDPVNMDEMCRSVICEVGNIVCCSYVNALARLMGIKIEVSVPDICSDMVGALLSVPMIHFANLSDELMLIENRFFTDKTAFTGHVLFLPEMESLEKMFSLLGI
ncbi:chemotaxis protein CheC [Murimonas intestini]|uniref:Chemotaxis protein CheC n=1 Tax=Murimonas intestini TaxID=1337051 RepID=A0AB73T2T8_9FIRM|nr:chemotaxis protein CheC [Murimonas intestini]MCR1841716.1 chemotaxis protein CheC [Murimonas intestini]MCR1865533.1 chemotaxis protein CheC [Murimonas intestini]MCR1883886.1 chemotaxis protein CheC [Murimonas intestini]